MMQRGDHEAFLKAAVPELEAYLLSDQLFWPLGSGQRMTLGNVLLALKEWGAVEPSDADHGAFHALREQIGAVRDRWRTNWSNKAEHEFEARLRQWDQALKDFFSEMSNKTVIYRQEVTVRAILELLKSEMLEAPLDDINRLARLDAQLRRATQPADFIWDAGWQNAFPPETYWFLYIQTPAGE